MANASPTTPVRAPEALCASPTDTPICALYVRLLDAIDVHVAAERAIADVDIWDPAFRGWLTDAERTHGAVTGLISTIRHADLEAPTDVHLVRVVEALDLLLGAETLDEALEAGEAMVRLQSVEAHGAGLAMGRVARLVAEGRARFRTLAQLEAYSPPGVDLSPALDLDVIAA
ncbi:hypothetical protein ACW9UR_24870 [Halovulum sp. GXIMD14794]